MCVCVCACIYIYMCIYIFNPRAIVILLFTFTFGAVNKSLQLSYRAGPSPGVYFWSYPVFEAVGYGEIQ